MNSRTKQRIVVIGAGFGGVYAAQTLGKLLKREGDYEVVLIDRNNYFLYHPLLVEASVGTIEARHVVVPVRKFLKPHVKFIMGEVKAIDVAQKKLEIVVQGQPEAKTFDFGHLVVGLGSVTRIPNIPGLKEFGFQIKSLGDGIELRDRAIRLLELANTIESKDARKSLLRVIVVGANYTGVEMAGEYEAFLHEAAKSYPNVEPDEIEVLLLEYSNRILASMDDRLARYVMKTLNRRGVKVMTNTTVTEVGAECSKLSNGEMVEAHTVVWTAGIAPHPLLAGSGLPLNEKGYIVCERDMQVRGIDYAWAVGDCATIIDRSGKPYAATAQNAIRQGPLLARNLVAHLQGRPTKPFDYGGLGSFAAFGAKRAAANVLGVDLTGFLGWVVYRGAYLMKFPTFRLKLRLLLDWIMDFFLPFPPVQLGVRRGEGSQSDRPL